MIGGSIIVFRSTNSLGLGQQVAELGVVRLYAVVEVEADLLVGRVFELFLEDEQFRLFLFEIVLFLLELIAMAGTGRFEFVSVQLFNAGRDPTLEWDRGVITETSNAPSRWLPTGNWSQRRLKSKSILLALKRCLRCPFSTSSKMISPWSLASSPLERSTCVISLLMSRSSLVKKEYKSPLRLMSVSLSSRPRLSSIRRRRASLSPSI